jgi:hypothetical protein
MTTDSIQPVKYIFLDVVAYTKRTIEAQCYIIGALNRIVKGAINRYHINEDSVIYMPTGDGICIALLGARLDYDIHVTVAKEILRRLHVNNSRVNLNWKKFDIRIGINQADDNLIIDIKGEKNVAGAGINNARRIMDLADADQILVSSTVYENLHPRKKYYHAFSGEYRKEVKHGLVLTMHQLISPDISGVDVNPPSNLIPATRPEPKLPKLTAYHFAHSIKNEKFFLNKARESTFNSELIILLIWFLAKESEDRSERSVHDIYTTSVMPETGSDTVEGCFEWFHENIPWEVALRICPPMLNDAVPVLMQSKYFEGIAQYLIINSEGREKLKKDWPEIWEEFNLNEITG